MPNHNNAEIQCTVEEADAIRVTHPREGVALVSIVSAPLGARAGLGLTAAGMVLAVGGCAVVRAAASDRLPDYGALFRASAGPGAGRVLDAVVTAFLFLTAGVTLAGGAALLHDCYLIPDAIGLAATALAATLLVRRGQASLFAGTGVLAPVLVLFLLVIAVLPGCRAPAVPGPTAPGVLFQVTAAAQGGPASAVASGMLYGAYNLVLGSGILVAGARYRDSRAALAGAAAGGAVLGTLAAAVLRGCVRGGPEVLGAQIPVAALAARLPVFGFHLFALTLGLAVVTTLGAVSTCLAERCRPRERSRPGAPAPVFVCLAVPVATLGFARLVRTVYPALGLLGLIWLGIWAASVPRQE